MFMSDSPKSSNRKLPIALALMFLVGIGFAAGLSSGLDVTNRMEVCVSCHSLKLPYEEYQQTVHYKNASGVRATCADCHVPDAFIPKLYAKVLAVKDIYHEIRGTIDTPEEFEARRWIMANRVWERMKANDSQTCRSCHDFASMDLSAQSRSARSRHSAAEDRGLTCIDCHKGIAHHEPEEPAEVVPEASVKPKQPDAA
jgi:cytochrome c-type protein NapC